MPNYEQRNASTTLRVFLCHSSGDKPAVRELYQRLCAEGIDAWLDEEKLLPGQDWQQEIPKAVRASDVVIVCLSPSSVTKAGYVQNEIKFALGVADEQPEDAIFLIPAKLQACDVPGRLTRWQWVNLYELKGYERLMCALRARAATLGIQRSPQYVQVSTGLQLETVTSAAPDLAGLRQKLADHFNKEELRTLCFDLGIQYENLPDTLDGMARELVAHCERYGRIPELVAACQRLRPQVIWDVGATLVVAQPGTATRAVPTIRTFGGIEFVFVPRGKFIMGSKDDDELAWDAEKPQHTVEVPYDYWVARFPVTNKQFAAFIEIEKYKYEMARDRGNKPDHPVTYVSWIAAVRYCQWLDETLCGELEFGLVARLSTEAEWEKPNGEITHLYPNDIEVAITFPYT